LVCVAVLVFCLLHVDPSVADGDSSNSRQSRVFAYYSTTSYTRLTTATITGISTCLSTAAAAACAGRRKRRNAGLDLLNDLDNDMNILETSVNGNEELEDRDKRSLEDEKVDREGRILTIWTTAFQTLTLTTTSLLSGTTITASAYCTGANGFPNGGVQACF
ncbi:unnamed protein product, partial [Meganyctiphanes norvegica]